MVFEDSVILSRKRDSIHCGPGMMPPMPGMPPPAGLPMAGAAAAGGGGGGGGGASSASAAAADEADDEPDEDEEAKMMAAMGIPLAFDSTAGKEVKDPRCKVEGVRKKEQRKYRQYMNRRGGFNRPLEETGGSGF